MTIALNRRGRASPLIERRWRRSDADSTSSTNVRLAGSADTELEPAFRCRQALQPVPGVDNVKYDYSYGASAFLETQSEDGTYFDGRGIEVFGQWQLKGRWWLIGGYNDLKPDDDDTAAGEFRTRFSVLGARYTPRSFERMLYCEYRLDRGRLADGSPRDDEFTIGIRWDFGI
jgi:hypothetical protein